MKHMTKNPRWHKLMTALFAFLIFQSILLGPCVSNASAAALSGTSSEHQNVSRIAGKNRSETSHKIADTMKDVLGIESFDAIIYASGQDFADALAGSYLSAKTSAPILLHSNSGFYDNINYIRNNLSTNGIVYILGGTNAVPAQVDTALSEYDISVQRLSGKDRYQTNLEILKAAGFSGGKILVCTSQEFADSLSASATGLPILLVSKNWRDSPGLSAEYIEYLNDFKKSCSFTIIGGYSVVSFMTQAYLAQYGSVERIYGDSRYDTSVKVAEHFFPAPSGAVLAYAKNFPDGLCGGPLAHAAGMPMLLVTNDHREPAASYVNQTNAKTGVALGGSSLISDSTVRSIFSLDASVMFPGAETHTHDYVSTVIPATCIEYGRTEYKCACGEIYTETHATYGDHDWTSWRTTKEATASEDGIQARICVHCEEEQSQKIPKRSYLNDSFVTLDTTYANKTIRDMLSSPKKTDFGKYLKNAQSLYNAIISGQTKELGLNFDNVDDYEEFKETFEEVVLGNLSVIYTSRVWSKYVEKDSHGKWVQYDYSKAVTLPYQIYKDLETYQKYYKINIAAGVYNGMNKRDAVFAINNWICTNISYEIACHELPEVLETKQANCSGYASLFYRLCQNANIPAQIIVGCAYSPDNETSPCPACHAWSKVKLDGTWYYLDTCWGYYLTETLWSTRSIFDEVILSPDGIFIPIVGQS